jgi:hypothetical protein
MEWHARGVVPWVASSMTSVNYRAARFTRIYTTHHTKGDTAQPYICKHRVVIPSRLFASTYTDRRIEKRPLK